MKPINFRWARRIAGRILAEPALLALSDQLLARDVRSLNPLADVQHAQMAVQLARQYARERGIAAAA